MADLNTTPELLTSSPSYDVENAVLERYKAGAQEVESCLCCATDYEGQYVTNLPQEIIEKDYGCGDPTQYVEPGEIVVDLGSGAGKICYILAQKVGSQGQVIGVDFNDEMLNLARKYQSEMSQKLGYSNVKFVKGKIQNLALDLDKVQQWLAHCPITSVDQLAAFETECSRLERTNPLIADNSVDVVVSNCVLNLVKPADKQQLFQEIYRVLKRGGRAVISDIVCDENPTLKIINDPELWSGCVAGAFREDQFLKMFENAGFYGIEILNRDENPWQVIDGIEFRAVTVRAFKGKDGPCLERNQAVVYKGPWKQVCDDDGHVYKRGERRAVCDKTYQILTKESSPYSSDIIPINPYQEISLETASEFDCKRSIIRDPQETKGSDYLVTKINESSCCSSEPYC